MDAELAANVRNNINEIYVSHELKKRAAAGTPFTGETIWAAQVILSDTPGGEPIVRLNDEVRLRVKTHDSDEWLDYLSVPKDGPSRIVAIECYPDATATR